MTTFQGIPWSVPLEKVRDYTESFEENLNFLFGTTVRIHKALGRTHRINRPITIVLHNGLAPSGHDLTLHTFSIGFASRDCKGQSKVVMPFSAFQNVQR